MAELATKSKPLELASVADGRVYRILPREKLVYINLGKEHQLSLGMRFVVFSPEVGLTRIPGI